MYRCIHLLQIGQPLTALTFSNFFPCRILSFLNDDSLESGTEANSRSVFPVNFLLLRRKVSDCLIDRLVNSCYFKKVQKTRTWDFERNNKFYLSYVFPVSKFPCQPILPTPGSLSFPRIPTLASLVN